MRIAGTEHVGANTAFQVTSVAGLWSVARRAAGRIRLRFDRVASQEVSAMHEVTFDGLWSPSFDRKILRRVMADVAVGLPVT
jgi:hypothetical protein